MTTESQLEILRDTRCSEKALESLRTDHLQILGGLENPDSEKKDADSVHDRIELLKCSLQKIDLGIAEAQVRYAYITVNANLYSASSRVTNQRCSGYDKQNYE